MRIYRFTLLAMLPGILCSLVAIGEDRVAWTTSRIVGTPEPPPKFKTVNAYPNLTFDKPTVVTSAPNSSRLFVSEQFGRIYSFPDDPHVRTADLFIDLKTELT
ncbi:MAG TPA: hypothetical protein VMM56_08255, partial [Planctomycetaceae bacterium]|nr:hypothetical protein [Planctomycetaceae bacterium]